MALLKKSENTISNKKDANDKIKEKRAKMLHLQIKRNGH